MEYKGQSPITLKLYPCLHQREGSKIGKWSMKANIQESRIKNQEYFIKVCRNYNLHFIQFHDHSSCATWAYYTLHLICKFPITMKRTRKKIYKVSTLSLLHINTHLTYKLGFSCAKKFFSNICQITLPVH